MAIKKSLVVLAFFITLFLLFSIILIGEIMNKQRKDYVEDQMKIISDLNEIQTFSLMSDVYGSKLACIAFKNKLSEWDKTLWSLGMKLEQYRAAAEEFQKDPFYLEQKKSFNENQVLYMAFLTKAKKECNLNVNIISFFYEDSKDCRKCDDQSFVLTDIKRSLKDEVSIFSYDTDLNLTNVRLLTGYYEIEEMPCVIIDEQKFCGMQDKDFIIAKMCETNKNMSACVQK